MRSILRKSAIVAVLGLPVACGGGGSGPTDPAIDIRGVYIGEHSFLLEFADNTSAQLFCDGRVNVTVSSGGSFGGTMVIDPCEEFDEPVESPIGNATVESDGSIRFVISGQEEALIEALQQEGCELIRVDDAFTGTVVGGVFTATITATVQCVDIEGDIDMTWTFQGTRTA